MHSIARKLAAIALIMVISFGQVCPAKASARKNIDMVLKYYKAGRLKKAESYVKKLPQKASRGCIKSLSTKEKKAYKGTVIKYYRKYAKGNDSDWHLYLHPLRQHLDKHIKFKGTGVFRISWKDLNS